MDGNPKNQPGLFPEDSLSDERKPSLSADASIQAVLGAFNVHMEDIGFSENTRKAFTSDVRLLGKYLGIGQPIGDIGTKELNDFLNWLLHERGVPCSQKSYARRVTTLKVLFGWLQESGVLLANPANEVIQISVTSPPPSIPSETEIDQALTVTKKMFDGVEGVKPDSRPYLLLTLLLKTGIKKGETMAIVPNHFDRDDPDNPYLFIRYKNPNLRYKERKISLDSEWLSILDCYLDQYKPVDTLFTCTARNLEYILTDVGEEAGIPRGMLSFENLRWVSALRDYRSGTEADKIRERLGISKITWQDTKKKLDKLAVFDSPPE